MASTSVTSAITCEFETMVAYYDVYFQVDFNGQMCQTDDYDAIGQYLAGGSATPEVSAQVSYENLVCPVPTYSVESRITPTIDTDASLRGGSNRILQPYGGGGWNGGGSCNFCGGDDDDRRALIMSEEDEDNLSWTDRMKRMLWSFSSTSQIDSFQMFKSNVAPELKTTLEKHLTEQLPQLVECLDPAIGVTVEVTITPKMWMFSVNYGWTGSNFF